MPFEVANALHRRVLRGELSVGDNTRMIARLLASRLELHQPPGLHVRAADERFCRAASPSIANVRWLGEFVEPE